MITMAYTCRRFKKTRKGKRCSDFGSKGHGKLSSKTRRSIQRGIRKGKFGGEGTFSSVAKCEAEVRTQKRKGTPYRDVARRIVLVRTFNKRKAPKTASIANSCYNYAKKEYSR